MNNRISWLLFDVSGVVVKSTLINPHGYKINDKFFSQKQLEGVFFDDDYTNYMLDTITHEQFIKNYVKKNNLDLTVEEFDEIFKKDITPTEDLEKLISKLAKKYKIALVTNEGRMFSKIKINGFKIKKYANKIVTSYEIKEIKPSINFFIKTLKAINAKPEECILIDDDIKNIKAAQSLGLTDILFKSTKSLKEELIKRKIIS